MRISKDFFWLLLIFFIQQLPMVADWGVDLPLIFVILKGLRTDAPRAAGWGFLCGAVQDLLSAGGIGPNVISKTMMGLSSSFFKTRIYREKVLTQTFLILGLSILNGVFEYFLMRWDGVAPRAEDSFWIIAHGVLMTTLVGLIVCFFVVRFRRRRFDPATA
jgi:rod shape-determining protein MreD